jgi:competence protein ComFC
MDLDGLVVAMHFQEGAVREIIHRFKYNEMLVLAEIMVPILVTTWQKHGVRCDAVTSIPLHYWRMKKRGYNQAEVLARKLATDFGLVYENALARVRNTVSQTGLTRAERQENLYRAFKACRQVKGRSWLIIDDVATTGATLEEAARALKDGGAKRVWGLVIARG